MAETRRQIQNLEATSKSELKEVLAEELGDNYDQQITNSLRNDFMRACYHRIASGEQPSERVRNHPNYDPSWTEKKSLATALRMLLTERVDRESWNGITSLDKQVLAELIVAIRDADEK